MTLILSLLYDFSLWIYYAIVSDLLTTIAHICAIILGLLIAIIFHCITKSIVEESTTQRSSESDGLLITQK